jgi:hypothetical protein
MPEGDTHTESESHPWTRLIPDHPERKDSSTYLASRSPHEPTG